MKELPGSPARLGTIHPSRLVGLRPDFRFTVVMITTWEAADFRLQRYNKEVIPQGNEHDKEGFQHNENAIGKQSAIMNQHSCSVLLVEREYC